MLAPTLTLQWTHSIEKTLWQEDYRVVDVYGIAQLELTNATIRGSGAGMEMPDGAVLKNGAWQYTPTQSTASGGVTPLRFPAIHLTHWEESPAAPYNICIKGLCQTLTDRLFHHSLSLPSQGYSVQLMPCPPLSSQ